MSSIIQALQTNHLLWRATDAEHSGEHQLSSGYALLDAKLGGGWPDKGVIELQSSRLGIGEVRLLLPALKAMAHHETHSQRLYLWVNPPGRLNGQALSAADIPLSQTLIARDLTQEQAFWVAEQSLRSGCCCAVILWCDELSPSQAKRLQLAAKEGSSLNVVLRPPSAISQSLPVSMRMRLNSDEYGLKVDITKRVGGYPVMPFALDMTQTWPQLTQKRKVTQLAKVKAFKAKGER